MKHPVAEAAFKPKQSRTETRQDATSRAARAIIEIETAALAVKTSRLRAARLARDAATPPVEAKARKRRGVG